MIQIFLFAGIGSSFLTWLYKRGIPKYLLLIFILQFSAVPNNGLSVITIWKDIPYGISLLWLTLVLSEIVSGLQICHSNRITIPEIIVCLLCVCLFRYKRDAARNCCRGLLTDHRDQKKKSQADDIGHTIWSTLLDYHGTCLSISASCAFRFWKKYTGSRYGQ
jgi:hypothetical protein